MTSSQQQTTNTNRTIPFNKEAEYDLLGCILTDPRVIDQVTGKLHPEDFYETIHQKIFEAMLEVNKRGEEISVITVAEELKRLNVAVDQRTNDLLIDMVNAVASTSLADSDIKIIEEKSLERKLFNGMKELSGDILNNSLSLDDLFDKTEDIIIDIIKKRRTSDFISIEDASVKVFDQIKAYVGNKSDLTGLDTGYNNLNRVTLGFQKGDLMILAARPSVGKSTYALNLALQVAKNNKASVAFFSLEMSIEQLMMRVFSNQAAVELTKIRNGNLEEDDITLLSLAKEEFKKINIFFDENLSTNISNIRTKCRQLKQAGKLDFLIIDYLQLVTAGNGRGNRQEEVSLISRQLKTLAQELQIPVLALSQLSRNVEGREDKEPYLADLRESGSIEQDADIVMFLYRRNDVETTDDVAEALQEEVNKLNNVKQDKKVLPVVLSIAKNRQGPLESFDYNFYGHIQRFAEQATFKKIIKKQKNKGTASAPTTRN